MGKIEKEYMQIQGPLEEPIECFLISLSDDDGSEESASTIMNASNNEQVILKIKTEKCLTCYSLKYFTIN